MIKFPLATEKSIRIMESENKIVFVVENNANKMQVKQAVEKEYNVKVVKVNIRIRGGRKEAIVKLAKENPAMDIATNLGIM